MHAGVNDAFAVVVGATVVVAGDEPGVDVLGTVGDFDVFGKDEELGKSGDVVIELGVAVRAARAAIDDIVVDSESAGEMEDVGGVDAENFIDAGVAGDFGIFDVVFGDFE